MPDGDDPSRQSPRASAGTLEYGVTLVAIALGLVSCALHAGIIKLDFREPTLAPMVNPDLDAADDELTDPSRRVSM